MAAALPGHVARAGRVWCVCSDQLSNVSQTNQCRVKSTRHALRSPDLRRDPCLGLSSACLVPLRNRESTYVPTLLLTSSPLTFAHTPTTAP